MSRGVPLPIFMQQKQTYVNVKRGPSFRLCGSLHFVINPRVRVQIKTLESEGAIMFAIPLMNVFQESSLRFHRLFKREKFSVV